MIDLTFEWDDVKAKVNVEKHGISFGEAKTVLGDPLSLTIQDMQHSQEEVRYITLGLSETNRLLVVVHTEHRSRTRIISSRRATVSERRKYEDET